MFSTNGLLNTVKSLIIMGREKVSLIHKAVKKQIESGLRTKGQDRGLRAEKKGLGQKLLAWTM